MQSPYFCNNLFYQHRVAWPAGAGGTNVALGVCQVLELRALEQGRLTLSFSVAREEAWRGFAVVKHYSRRADDPSGSIYVCERTGGDSSIVSLLDLGCRVLADGVASRNAIKVVGYDKTAGGLRMDEASTCHFFSTTPFFPRSIAVASSTVGRPPQKWSSQELEQELSARGLPPLNHKEAALAILKSIVVSDLLERTTECGMGKDTSQCAQTTMATYKEPIPEALLIGSYSAPGYLASVSNSSSGPTAMAAATARMHVLQAPCLGHPSTGLASQLSATGPHPNDLRPTPPASSLPEREFPRSAPCSHSKSEEPSRSRRNSRPPTGRSPHALQPSQEAAILPEEKGPGFYRSPRKLTEGMLGSAKARPPSSGAASAGSEKGSFRERWLSFTGKCSVKLGASSEAEDSCGEPAADAEPDLEREMLQDSEKQMWLLRSSLPVALLSSFTNRALESQMSVSRSSTTSPSELRREFVTSLSRTSSVHLGFDDWEQTSSERGSAGSRLFCASSVCPANDGEHASVERGSGSRLMTSFRCTEDEFDRVSGGGGAVSDRVSGGGGALSDRVSGGGGGGKVHHCFRQRSAKERGFNRGSFVECTSPASVLQADSILSAASTSDSLPLTPTRSILCSKPSSTMLRNNSGFNSVAGPFTGRSSSSTPVMTIGGFGIGANVVAASFNARSSHSTPPMGATGHPATLLGALGALNSPSSSFTTRTSSFTARTSTNSASAPLARDSTVGHEGDSSNSGGSKNAPASASCNVQDLLGGKDKPRFLRNGPASASFKRKS